MDNVTIQINLNIPQEMSQAEFFSLLQDALQQYGATFAVDHPSPPLQSPSCPSKKRKKRGTANSFILFAEQEIKRLEEAKRYSTSRNYRTAIRSFVRFREDKNSSFADFCSELMVDYETWLKQSGVCLNTISCYMRALSAIYNKAVERELCEQRHPFSRVFTGMEKTVKRAIASEDIQALNALSLEGKRPLELTRDLFIFSFFARGMPFVDMAYLKKKQIQNGYLIYYRHKTQQQLQVKLEPCMQEIINYYITRSDSEYVFPIITSTDEGVAYKQYREKLCYYNKLLKQLSAMLEGDQHLTSYVPRHTWASLAYLSEIELPTIARALGHNTPLTTLTYVKELGTNVVDEANAKLISKILFNKKKPTSI